MTRHIGRNIERIRELKGIKQDVLAKELGITQQAVSKIEQSEEVDEERLQQIAKILEVLPETIKDFSEETAIYNIQHNSDTSSNNTIVNYQFNPVDKIIELYERIIKDKDLTIETLKKQIG